MPEIKYLKQLVDITLTKASIYHLAAPGVDLPILKKMASLLGLSIQASHEFIEQSQKMLTYRMGNKSVSMFRASGGFRFRDDAHFQVDDGKAKVEYNDIEAADMATKIVHKFDLAQEGEYNLVKVTHLFAGEVDVKTGKSEERAIDTGVIFRRIVDKIPIEGPGGMVIIYLDPAGEMTGLDRVWRVTDQVYKSDLALRSPAQAKEGLQKFLSGYSHAMVEVEDMRFGYFEQGRNVSQRYLQPAYIFPYNMETVEMHGTVHSVFVYEASVSPVGKIMPVKKVELTKPVRQE